MSKSRYAKLRGRIVEKETTQAAIAKKIGISPQAMSKKMNGETGFSQDDVIRICAILDIDLSDVGSFFYA